MLSALKWNSVLNSENIFSRVYQKDFESLDVVVIINFWLLQMASSRRTYTVAETPRYILEGDGSELDRTDSDIEIVVNWGLQIGFS